MIGVRSGKNTAEVGTQEHARFDVICRIHRITSLCLLQPSYPVNYPAPANSCPLQLHAERMTGLVSDIPHRVVRPRR